jgi:hypothetical protein
MRFKIAKASKDHDLYAKYLEKDKLFVVQDREGELITTIPEELFSDRYIILGIERD